MQKSQLPPTYLSPFTRSKGIVRRAAPKAFFGDHCWVWTKIARIFTVNDSCGTGQPQAAAAENRPGLFGHDFLCILFFSYFFPHQKVFFPKKGSARS
jgi:hypothetical protein